MVCANIKRCDGSVGQPFLFSPYPRNLTDSRLCVDTRETNTATPLALRSLSCAFDLKPQFEFVRPYDNVEVVERNWNLSGIALIACSSKPDSRRLGLRESVGGH